ncbi:MAG: carboxypeptidase-like regulatory domain-containing protein, partial [Candidatus Gracilibacteria bacterium]
GAADLAGNPLYNPTNFQTPIVNSQNTMGMLGPMMGGGGGGMMGPNMGTMGIMKAGAFPMNATAGQTTIYFVDMPTSQAVASGYKIVLTYPSGFNVAGAKKDPYSPINKDINEWNTGTVTFATTTESSGGAANDGVTVDTAARAITITLVVYGTASTSDFLHFDLAGITNSSIPRGFDTSGYSVDMKIMKADGTLAETVNGMPFFLNQGGVLTLSGSITLTGATGTTDGTMKLYLGSPMTGPMDLAATITNGAGSYSFTGLSAGSYMLFTEPTLSFPDSSWIGRAMPEPLNISASTTKDLTFSKENSGSVLDLTVNLAGNFNNTDIDVFAGSPQGFKVKTFLGATTSLPAVHFYLPAGDWMVGVGPAMPKGVVSGPPPMPDWMPPMPQMVKSLGTGTSSLTMTINTANLQIIGYVQDESAGAIAAAEVYAYQPGNSQGMGAYAKTDTAGKFTLKLAQAGNYTVGTFKPGLPNVPEKNAAVAADSDSGATDGNATADITADGRLITAANKFIFKIIKPGRTISGKVTNGTNPVSFAPVWADKVGGFGHTDTMTDSSGNYILYADAGAWRIQSYIPGFGNAEPQTVVVGTTADVTQNLGPESAAIFYTIGGTITIGGTAQAYRPIRAVQYNASGVYTGKEYRGQTDSSGVYSISVPGTNNYRVDIWTQEYGEVGLDADDDLTSPANVIIASANVTGKDITITSGNLIDISLSFVNKAGYGGKEAFINIEGVSCSGATCKTNGFRKGLRITDLNSFNETIKLQASAKYFFSLDIPGFGNYIPITNANTGLDSTTGSVAATTTNRTVSFTLPDTGATTVAISGTVLEGAASSSGAWVWVGNPANGYRNGVKTAADGTYSITIPTGSGYKMGADKPGYMSNDPLSFNATSTAAITGRNFTLAAKSLIISGYIYNDADSDNALDAGEALPGGWVRAETSDGKKTQTPTDGTGYFELGVVNGAWTVYGVADGYLETSYSSGAAVTVAGANVGSINIKLSANSAWSNKNKKTPITPASGGTMDDTAPDGSGV